MTAEGPQHGCIERPHVCEPYGTGIRGPHSHRHEIIGPPEEIVRGEDVA